MSLLAPNLDNFRIEFDREMFPEYISGKYDKFLFSINSPIKTIKGIIEESIISYTTPSITIPEITVNGLNNTGKNGINSMGKHETNTKNIDYISNGNFDDALGNKILTINLRNNLWNYVYLNEMMREMFKRNNNLKEFRVTAIMRSEGDIPLMKLTFRNCIIKSLPEITYTHADTLSANPTFDLTVRFNNYDFEFMIPDFKETLKILG